MAPWSPGSSVGSYEILDILGRGGMGAVYRVRHLITNRIEAIKVIGPGSGSIETKQERFHREVRLLASLAHPNIAVLHTAFEHEGQLVMVMEYVQGEDLGTRLRSGITLNESLHFARQILHALHYAHSKGVVHRDIKPSNIMVTSSREIKLLDFGLSLGELDTRLTATGMLVGSMHYVSPELIAGETGDVCSDLYAVGVTVYEMITGRLPIEGKNHVEIIANHLRHQPLPPNRWNAKVPEALANVVMKALKKEKAERWQSAADFLSALDAVPQLGTDADVTVTTIARIPDSPSTPTKTFVQRADSASLPERAQVHPEVLTDITARLASHVGPIAKILVKRASGTAHDVRELCEIVAREIDSDEKRRRFLHSVESHMRTTGHD
jgi:eukaryotic-like serine/threonine-protein kinase